MVGAVVVGFTVVGAVVGADVGTVVGAVVGAVVWALVVPSGVKTMRSRFWPSPTNRSVRTRVPDERGRSTVAIVQVENPPVFGIGTVAATLSSTDISTAWLPVPQALARIAARYCPDEATGTVYRSHSPLRT